MFGHVYSRTNMDGAHQIDYSQVNGRHWAEMPRDDFVNAMRQYGFVGDQLVRTHHQIGASKWHKVSDDYVIGHHQLRAAHQRFTDADLRVVQNKGCGHSIVQMFYRRLQGEWKLAGMKPMVRWHE